MKIIVSSIREEGGMGMHEQNLVLPARGTLFRGSNRKFFVVCIPWMWALISIFQASIFYPQISFSSHILLVFPSPPLTYFSP